MLSLFVIALLSGAKLSSISPPLDLTNMDFEDGAVGQPPPGWFGSNLWVSDDHPHSGLKSVTLTSVDGKVSYFGKSFDAPPFRGRTVVFRAAVRASIDGPGGAGLWLRADAMEGGKPKVLAIDNTHGRWVARSDWVNIEAKIFVPPDAEKIVMGGLMSGKGTAGFDMASLEVLPESTGPEAPEAKAYLDHVIRILRTRHINSGKVNWIDLSTRAERLAAHAHTPEDTYPAIDFVIRQLGERHTSLRRPPAKNTTVGGPIVNPAQPMPRMEQVSRNVGLLWLPLLDSPTSSKLSAAYNKVLRDAIEKGRANGVCGWIIDLRDNGGGNMWPMIDGLSPLIAPGPRPAFVKPDGEREAWQIPASSGAVAAHPTSVAVLIGPGTASSGEMTALAFAGSPNARLFGAPSAGLTTANSPVSLSDGAVLILTESYVEDRSGRRIEGAILPDEGVTPDAAVSTARAWLHQRGCD